MACLNIKSTALRRTLAIFATVQLLFACDDNHDDTAAVQRAVDRGGVVKFDPRIYYLSRTIVIHRSNTVIQGAGPQTVFQFQASSVREHCANDRVFTTPCEVYFEQPARRIAKAVAIGDRSFSATDDASDIQPGDWLLITDKDAVIGDVVTSDWVQADSVSNSEVHVRTPFRTAFANSRIWEPGISGLGFRRIVPLVENTEFRNFNVIVPTGTSAVGISVIAALHTTIDHVVVDSFNGQPLYSYVSKDLTVTNSDGHGHGVLNELAATVDLTVRGNRFSEDDAAALGLDLGTGFFDVSNNEIAMSRNIGGYLLYGVHDGTFGDNRIGFVGSGGNAFGILAWGTQNISISDNYLAGGEGPRSTGISVRSYAGAIVIPSINVTLSGNTFGSGWAFDYVSGSHLSN
jgi:hypothetical protein